MPNPAAPVPHRSPSVSRFWLSLALLAGIPAALPAQSETEVAALRQRAESGDPDAQVALGNLLAAGRGVAADPAQAVRLYRQAAEKGVAAAHFNLGLAYETGRGVAVDERQAFRHYLMAAEQGLAAAQFNVGNMYASGRGVAQDAFEANLWFRQAAEKGVVEAQYNLGLAYETGRGVRKDESQAARWLGLAAERGFAQAQFRLGVMREEGRGGPENPAAAAALYRAAAEQGFAPAQNNLGLLLAQGAPGVAKDLVQGYAWLSLAAENGLAAPGRDVVGQALSEDQRAAATRLAADLKAGRKPAAGATGSASVPDQAYVDGLEELVAKLRAANEELANTNQRLVAEKAQAARLSAPDAAPDRLVEDLRAQGARLAAANQQLATEKELAEREKAAIAAQLKDAEAELARLRVSPAASLASAPVGSTELRAQLESAVAQKNEAEAALGRAREDIRRLADENTRLTQAAANPPQVGAGAESPDAAARIRNLERDNERLNDEVKRSTRELLSLNSQLRQAREQRAVGAEGNADAALKQENSRLARAAADAEQRAAQAEGGLEALRAQVRSLEQRLAERPASADPGVVDDLRRQLAAARDADAALRAQLAEANSALAKSEASVAELTGENDRLARDLGTARQQLQAASGDRELQAARREIAALEGRLREALAQRAPAADDRTARELAAARTEITALEERLRQALAARPAQSGDAAFAKLEAQVAELTGENDRLERDLETARKAADAALAAQQQAVTAARPDAYQMEIRTLQDRVKQLEATLEEDRGNSARELAAVAAQLQRTRDANRALTEANRALLAAQESADTPTRAEVDEAQARIRDLTIAGDEMRRQIQALSDGKAAAEQRAEQVATELAALQARATEADKAAETHGAAVAELTGENEKLAQARDALARQLEALRSEVAQHQQTSEAAERQRLEAERSASLNVNAMAAQLAELRRDLEAARTQNARLIESNNALERERSTVMARLRNENAALTARLAQAQSTLDQIASAARLGTPASQIAAGGTGAGTVNPVPVPAAPASEPRFHTVMDGDSLSRISLRYYGTSARWQEIFEANREELRGANTLRVGQRLRIP